MMISTSFIRWAAKQLRPWQDRREARQRQERREMMLRVDPQLRAAHERLERDRKRHAPTKADIAAVRHAVHSRLWREVQG